jgi:hypothetical protein
VVVPSEAKEGKAVVRIQLEKDIKLLLKQLTLR